MQARKRVRRIAHRVWRSHDPLDQRKIFLVTHSITVSANDRESAEEAYLFAVCSGDQSGPGWHFIQDNGLKVHVVAEDRQNDPPYIKVTKVPRKDKEESV